MFRVMRDFRANDGSIVKRDTLLNKLREQIEVGTHRKIIIVATAEGHRIVITMRDLDNGVVQEDCRS